MAPFINTVSKKLWNFEKIFETQKLDPLYSLAVEGLDPEKIGIEEILVSKEAEFFVEEHIQNPPKSTLGKLFYSKLKFAIKMYTELYNDTYTVTL